MGWVLGVFSRILKLLLYTRTWKKIFMSLFLRFAINHQIKLGSNSEFIDSNTKTTRSQEHLNKNTLSTNPRSTRISKSEKPANHNRFFQ